MGEAKRRKQLDPNWGKRKLSRESDVARQEESIAQLREELLSLLEPDDPADLPQIRTIGEKLNQEGGFSLMYRVADSLPREYQRTVDVTWHRIGEWRA